MRPVVGDTETVGYSDVTGGSRVTYATGMAAYEAAQDIKSQLIDRAAQLWEVAPDAVEYQAGVLTCRADPAKRITFQELAGDIQSFIRDSMPEWKTRYPGVEGLNVAVMGCIVNGPGESKHADIGISLPGTGETPTAPVFIDGRKAATLRGATLAADFKQLVMDYIERRYGGGGAGRTAAE